MKKVLCLVLVLLLSVGVCLADESDLLARIQAEGKLVVAMEGTWQPWTYHDDDDVLVGFDVDVARAIAGKLGVEVEFAECPWDSLFGGLGSGRYDLILNGVEYTDERAEKYAMSTPYAYIRTALIVRGDNESIKSFEDLNGKKTANTLSSTYAALGESYGATTVGVDDFDQTIMLLVQGRIDATINAEVSFYDYIAIQPDANIKIAAVTEEASSVCATMRSDEDSASFVEAVNAAIAELIEEGVIAEYSLKYFGSDLTK